LTDFDITAGLKFTSSKMQLLELQLKSGVVYVKDLNEVFFNEKVNFLKDKETKISALLQGAFDEALLQRSLKDIYVSVTVPQNLFYSVQLPFEESLLYSDLVEEFRWQLSLLYPFIDAKELLIQYFPLPQNEFQQTSTAFVTALPRNIVQIFLSFCKSNNLKLRFIDSSHTASDRALIANRDITSDNLILSLFVEEKVLSFTFYHFGEPFLFSNLTFDNASEIPHLVQKEISKHKFEGLVNGAFISGDEISNSFTERLSEKTNITFNQFNPFSKLQLEPEILDNKFYLLKNNSFSSAVGISIRSL
jgi:Tfp pilus assembly PilM family ATPase